jgi:creatinine amidohydrolase
MDVHGWLPLNSPFSIQNCSGRHSSAAEDRMRFLIAVLAFASASALPLAQTAPASDQGSRLEDLSWTDAKRVLTPDTVVVIPLGAASKEHGPHLKLRNDLSLAEYLTRRVLQSASVVVAPTLTYHYYPAFLEYAGSTSLSLNAARDMTADVARSLARYGPRRFYVLNMGMSTVRALDPAASALAAEGILLRYTRLDAALDRAARGIREQEGGSHADEIETSMMLYIDPASVDMARAVKDLGPATTPLRLTLQRDGPGTYSPSGIWGDPTLATREKGRAIVESLLTTLLDDIESLRGAPLPATSAAPSVTQPPNTGMPAAAPASARQPISDRCTPGDERVIRAIGDAFAAHWANADAELLSKLWSREGDIVHPDGLVERGSETIRQNRASLFARREYRGTRHPLAIGNIRCVSADVAVADGKWELRGVTDRNGSSVPTLEGLCTLVVKRGGSGWSIEAYRYTTKTPTGNVPPTVLKRPGFPGGVIK